MSEAGGVGSPGRASALPSARGLCALSRTSFRVERDAAERRPAPPVGGQGGHVPPEEPCGHAAPRRLRHSGHVAR
ncbi:hypothetical protein NDU88_008052 [Pleurodeles waltl]|uniref:Uncharacterized protein n=1 Tax=Pleurodeles waltl TaxID=8319 RepID=A0AAV7N7N8_PLEWA|nr:hypothetical protein NDU88_008052 [Pleurodeles waltl]